MTQKAAGFKQGQEQGSSVAAPAAEQPTCHWGGMTQQI